jgi:plastocyanin
MNNLFANRRMLACIAVGLLSIPLAAISAMALIMEEDVDQIALRFTKPSVVVKLGGTVKFHNSDDVIHNIMTIDSDDMTEDFGLQKPGEIIRATFEHPGTFQVRCSIHPKMKMTVSVNP